MRSHLTRHVFKRLLSNEVLIFRCPHRSRDFISQQYAVRRVLRQPARRTMFGFSASQQVRDADIDPGLSKMMDLVMALEAQVRPPPATELVRAFNAFFLHKSRKKEAVNNIQTQNALDTFIHLRETNTSQPGFGLSLSDLETARDCMAYLPVDDLLAHKYFSLELYAEISRRKLGADGEGEAGTIEDLVQITRVLTLTGDSMRARKLVEEFWKSSPEAEKLEHPVRIKGELWMLVLRGFAKEQNEKELINTERIAEDSGVPYNPTSHEIMTTFYATKDDTEKTKSWYMKEINKKLKPHARTVAEVLRVCLRKNEVDWCNSVFRDLLESNPPKLTWDVIFRWAASVLGKGVEDIERMMEVMVRRNAQDDSVRPDPETINGLLEFAISRNDPYLAERYLTLGSKMGIRQNARTFILQMGYRIDAGDVSGAQAAYDALQGEEAVEQEDLPVINKFIRALCSGNSSNYDQITSLVADLEERKVRLEANTISALCLMYLKRGELDDATDVLRAHIFHYTLDERASIRDKFLAFCLDRTNNTTDAWEVYQILRQMFDETDIAMRTQLMNEFFGRKRCDMACFVFGHMRQHDLPDKRPTSETYVQCFEGIAKCEDTESLDMVHNMMKMDSSIEPSTKLYNALMLAYTAVRKPNQALDLWTDITNSIEGPTYNSLEIVFRTCEVKVFGHKTAKEIWKTMRRMEIEITPAIFSAYVGALAGSSLFDEVRALIEGMEKDVGFGPDMMTLGISYNAMRGDPGKEAIEQWAGDVYPDLWAELEKLGRRYTEDGIRLFNIVREVKA